MKLKNKTRYKIGILSEYLCDLTTELDTLAKLENEDGWGLYHYIIIDEFGLRNKCLALRVHGGTVGDIHINDDNIITRINIDNSYVIQTYPPNLNEIINKKYIGERLEW